MTSLAAAVLEVFSKPPCAFEHDCDDGLGRSSCILPESHMDSRGNGPFQTLPDGRKIHTCCYGHEFFDDGSAVDWAKVKGGNQ